MNCRITQRDTNEFLFEYDTLADAKQLENLKTFTYEDKTYTIKKYYEGFNISEYHSYLVITEK